MYTNAADVIVVQPGASHLVQQLLVYFVLSTVMGKSQIKISVQKQN